jgi:hypothetical protein
MARRRCGRPEGGCLHRVGATLDLYAGRSSSTTSDRTTRPLSTTPVWNLRTRCRLRSGLDARDLPERAVAHNGQRCDAERPVWRHAEDFCFRVKAILLLFAQSRSAALLPMEVEPNVFPLVPAATWGRILPPNDPRPRDALTALVAEAPAELCLLQGALRGLQRHAGDVGHRNPGPRRSNRRSVACNPVARRDLDDAGAGR